jgi:hypothetical protein
MKKFLPILLFLILTTTANAQLSYKKFSYFQNSGGLNDSLASTAIADNEATAIQNVVFDSAGAISKRYGYQNIGPTTGSIYQVGGGNYAVTGLAYYTNPSTGNKYIVAIANVNGQATGYEKQLGSNNSVPYGAWTSIGSTGLPSNYTNDEQPVMTSANGVLIISFPSSPAQQAVAWQATSNIYTFSNPSINSPNSACNAYFNNIMFFACDPANPTRVSFTNLSGAFNSFVATDFFTLNLNDGHYITGLFPCYGNLYIFEDNSIWMLTGSSRDTFNLQQMVPNVGTVSPHSIQLVNNDIYFITKQNDIAIYDGTFTVKFLSTKIRNTIGNNNFVRAPQALGLGFSSYKYKDLDYYVSESTIGNATNNQVLMFDTDRKAWTKFANFNPDSWTVIPSTSGQDQMVFGDYNGNVYFYPNIGNYNDVSNTCTGGVCTQGTSAIYSYYQTKWFTYPDVSLGDKYFRVLKTYIQNSTLSSTLTTQINYDFNIPGKIFNYKFTPSGSDWGIGLWGQAIWESTQELNIDREEPGVGKQMFQILYSNDNLNEDMTMLGWETFIEPTSQL